MKVRLYNRRYIVGVFRNGRGAGLLTVFGRSKKQARAAALNVIGKRKLEIGPIESFRKFATPQVKEMAVDFFVAKHWNKAMT